MADLDLTPRDDEVAAAWLPAGYLVTLHGVPVPAPSADYPRYAVVGWRRLSGGALICTYGGWQGIRNGQDKDSRSVWDEAAKILRRAERLDAGPAAVYVTVEDQPRYGRRHWVATGVREG